MGSSQGQRLSSAQSLDFTDEMSQFKAKSDLIFKSDVEHGVSRKRYYERRRNSQPWILKVSLKCLSGNHILNFDGSRVAKKFFRFFSFFLNK